MPKPIGVVQTTVDVVDDHVYEVTVDGITGPATVHDGDTVEAPTLARLHDNRRVFRWRPDHDGRRTLLVTAWPGQRGEATVTVRDLGRTTLTFAGGA